MVKQISDNEIYLLIKYIKSLLWWAAKRLSYIEEARCLKVNYAINGACLQMVLLTDVYRNLTSLWIKPQERAFKQFKSPVLNVLKELCKEIICLFLELQRMHKYTLQAKYTLMAANVWLTLNCHALNLPACLTGISTSDSITTCKREGAKPMILWIWNRTH